MQDLIWDRSNPHIIDVTATKANVDGYGHVSTHNYVQWMIDCAFAHSAALGLSETTCAELARGMAAVDLNVQLLGAAYEGDQLEVATWIVDSDMKLRLKRQFQIVHVQSARTITRGQCAFVCTNLKTGRPTRMPQIFKDTYVVASAAVDSAAKNE